MKARPVDQHYVSAAYLRGFVPDGEEALWVRRRVNEKWFREVPANIATRKNFYSVLLKDGSWDDSIEHSLDRNIEAPGFRALVKLLNRDDTLDHFSRNRIAILLAMQYLRIPQFRRDIEKVLKEYLQGFTEHAPADSEKFAKQVQELEGLDPTASMKMAKEAKHGFASGEIELVLRREAALPYIFNVLEEHAQLFEEYEWMVYVSPEAEFYSCDRPVYISPSSVKAHQPVALVDPNTEVHVPLSSRRFLILRNFRKRERELRSLSRTLPMEMVRQNLEMPPAIEYVQADRATIDRLNSQTARTAEEWICGPSESTFMDREIKKAQLKMTFEVHRNDEGMKIIQKLVEVL